MGGLFICPYPLNVQACPTRSRVSGKEGGGGSGGGGECVCMCMYMYMYVYVYVYIRAVLTHGHLPGGPPSIEAMLICVCLAHLSTALPGGP